MSEGAIVKLLGESLAAIVTEKQLLSVDVISSSYTKKDSKNFNLFSARLPTKVVGIGAHGKFLYWIVTNDVFIYSTLGPTCSWTTEETQHSRVAFNLEGDLRIFFNDEKNSGALKTIPGRAELIKKLTALGPDILSEVVSDARFTESLMTCPETTVVEAMMNQDVISGIGQCSKSEILYKAKISPHREIRSFSQTDFSNLKHAMQTVLSDVYRSNKSLVNIHTYSDFDSKDLVSEKYNMKFQVYNQSLDPGGNAVIMEKTLDGTPTYWVPSIQR